MSANLECSRVQTVLVDSLAGSLADDERTLLAEHLRTCAECTAAARELREGWEMFSDLPAVEPPPDVHRRTRAAVLEAFAAERAAAATQPWGDLARIPLAVAAALVATAATLLLLGGLLTSSGLHQGHVFFCAAIFTGLLVGAFSWIFSATTVNGLHLDTAARIGVLALAITVAATTACPELHVLAWWDRSALGQSVSRLIGAGGGSLVFGFAYGMVPGFLGALFGGRLLAARPVANSLIAAAVVFLLAAPVIYLQSVPFASGVIASWVAGIAAGTLCGVSGAVRVRQRVGRLAGASF